MILCNDHILYLYLDSYFSKTDSVLGWRRYVDVDSYIFLIICSSVTGKYVSLYYNKPLYTSHCVTFKFDTDIEALDVVEKIEHVCNKYKKCKELVLLE